MNEWIGAFVAITSLAVLIQAGVMVGLFLTVRKTSQRMEQIAGQVETRLLPILENTRDLMADATPKLKDVASQLVESSIILKSQMQRVDSTMRDVADRSRLQIIRMDQMLSSTLNKIEETTELVNETVINPVKQVSGIMQGLSVGIGAFFAGRKQRTGNPNQAGQDEEMFI
jgi:hypothetical protein